MRRFLSVCSGIEAASVAFQPLGWEAVAFAEIEPFPCQVLNHRYGASRPYHMPVPPNSPEFILQTLNDSTPWASWAITHRLLAENAPFEANIRAVSSLPNEETAKIPNLGDLTRFRDWPSHLLEQADILCGGTPCQAFSVAGLRGSLDDERGNLTLTFVHLYDHLDTLRKLAGRPPAVCIWENVPGIFSDKQNAFGCFLAGLVGEAVPLQPAGGRWTHAGAVCGPERTAAWRVLDAQYHGLAQRRQRVVVVASADPAFDTAAVLFEWDGLRRDTPPSREPGQSTAPTLSDRAKGGGGLGTDAECDGAVIAEPRAMIPEAFGGNNTSGSLSVAPAVNANRGCHNPGDFESGTLLVTGPVCSNGKAAGPCTQQDAESGMLIVTHSLRGEGFDASEDGTGRGTPIIPEIMPTLRAGVPNGGKGHGALARSKDDYIIPVAYRTSGNCGAWETGDKTDALTTSTDPFAHVLAFQPRIARNGRGDTGDIINALNAQSGQTGKGDSAPCVAVMEVVGFKPRHYRAARKDGAASEIAGTLTSSAEHAGDGSPHVAYTLHGTREGTREVATQTDLAGTIREGTGSAIQNSSNTLVQNWAVRRLTCEECELLQGFPIGYTLIPGKGKRKGEDLQQTTDYLIALGFPPADAAVLAHCPDGPRYKALGNSWAVPVFTWVGTRVERMLSNAPLS